MDEGHPRSPTRAAGFLHILGTRVNIWWRPDLGDRIHRNRRGNPTHLLGRGIFRAKCCIASTPRSRRLDVAKEAARVDAAFHLHETAVRIFMPGTEAEKNSASKTTPGGGCEGPTLCPRNSLDSWSRHGWLGRPAFTIVFKPITAGLASQQPQDLSSACMRMQPCCTSGNFSTRTGDGLDKAARVCAEPYHNLIRFFAFRRPPPRTRTLRAVHAS